MHKTRNDDSLGRTLFAVVRRTGRECLRAQEGSRARRRKRAEPAAQDASMEMEIRAFDPSTSGSVLTVAGRRKHVHAFERRGSRRVREAQFRSEIDPVVGR